MFENSFHSHDVFLVLKVGVVQLPKDLGFFTTSNIPVDFGQQCAKMPRFKPTCSLGIERS